ncbi:adhesion G-protein coupled receptor G2-like [Physella acuta]|uniref:adhesion G-protein coupled receptor G2-like n=1 Tax=Physella acuta TaxID=109671 RepID=UPI0027DD6BA0|nr:adhesion G-protein coupled receptor G2-like [Physella acuta]
MCSNSTPMAGRTLDVNYNLTYAKFKHDFTADLKDRNSPKFLDFQNNVALALKEITSSLPRGINSRVVSCELVRGKELHVLVNFDLTVINAYSHDAVKNALLKELQLHLHKEGGFFHRENTDVTTVYLWDQGVPNSVLKWKDNPKNPSPSPTTKVCPPSLTENGTVVIFWRETEAGHYDVSSIGADRNRTFYKRKCHENYGVPYWGPVERYELTNKETDMEKDPVSASASIVLEISEQMSPELSRQLLDDLENLTDDVAVPGVAGNLLTASSLMMDVLLQDSAGHVLPSVDSERLLTIIEKTAYNVPLTDGLFRFVKKNVAVAAIAIDSAQISDVRLVINSRSRKDLVDDMIGVDVDSKLQTEETTSLLFSLKSIPRERRDKLKMAVFTVFPSGVLFATDYTQSPNSYILSVQIPHLQNEHLDDDVIMTFYHFNDTTRGPSCKYWRTDAINTTLRHKDGRRGKWARDGCRVVRSDQEKTVCSCSHMTNFALIMDVYQLAGSTLDEENIYSLKLISQAGCTISLLGLSFTLLSYTIFSRLRRDEPSKILYSLCWALFLCNGFFVFGAEIDILQSRLGCKFLAAVLHYLLTSSIFWMAVNAYYMYLMLVRVFNIFISHFYIKAACVGWGIPLILVVVTLAIDKTETYGKLTSGICWIRSPAFYFVFVVPVVMVLLFNLTVFCLILRQLSMMARSTATQHSRQERKRFLGNFRAIVSLVVLLGLTWIFAFFAVGHASMLFSYLFAVCNSLQGLLVFLFYCVFKKDVIHAWENLFGLGKESSRQDKFSYTQDPGKTYDENTVSIDRRDTNTFEPSDLLKTSTRTSGDTIM